VLGIGLIASRSRIDLLTTTHPLTIRGVSIAISNGPHAGPNDGSLSAHGHFSASDLIWPARQRDGVAASHLPRHEEWLAGGKQADGNSEPCSRITSTCDRGRGTCPKRYRYRQLGRALLGEREGGLLVVEGGGLGTEHEGEGHDWMERRSPNLRRDELSAERPSDVLAGVGWCPRGRDSTIW